MKTHDIEVQRIRAMRHDHHGTITAHLDALVQASTPRGDEPVPTTTLRLNVDDARVLMLLLKQHLAELEPRKGKSQR